MHPFNTAKKIKSTEKVVIYFKMDARHAAGAAASPMKSEEKRHL
jgi:hypothetical protein